MDEPLHKLLAGLHLNEGATALAISNAEDILGESLPLDYVSFLSMSDGVEGDFGAAYAQLWSAAEIASLNVALEVRRYIPSLTLIGGNGGDEAFGFVTAENGYRYVCTPFIESTLEYSRELGTTFIEFLKSLQTGPII